MDTLLASLLLQRFASHAISMSLASTHCTSIFLMPHVKPPTDLLIASFTQIQLYTGDTSDTSPLKQYNALWACWLDEPDRLHILCPSNDLPLSHAEVGRSCDCWHCSQLEFWRLSRLKSSVSVDQNSFNWGKVRDNCKLWRRQGL